VPRNRAWDETDAASAYASRVGAGAQANKLHPVLVEGGESIYAPIPVSLSVELDAGGGVKSIDGGTPNPAAIADAARYVKTLRVSGQLASAGEQQPASGLTHWIERNEQGRQVLRRKSDTNSPTVGMFGSSAYQVFACNLWLVSAWPSDASASQSENPLPPSSGVPQFEFSDWGPVRQPVANL
jgi:hypothetical protein